MIIDQNKNGNALVLDELHGGSGVQGRGHHAGLGLLRHFAAIFYIFFRHRQDRSQLLIIVDYVNVFRYMQRALTEYATGDDGKEFPAKDIDKLIELIGQAIDEADQFLLGLGIDISAIIANASTFDRLDDLRDAYNTIIANDENKDKFKVILNTLTPPPSPP